MKRKARTFAPCRVGVIGALILVLPLAQLLIGSTAHAGTEFDPATGYRISNYRGPTPATVPGGTAIDIEELQRLRRERQAILLDVMSAEGAGFDPATGAWRLSKPRRNMEGSVWLPDVGRGVLTPQLDGYFRDNLERLSSSNKTYPIIVYCQADCWMSWNAVQRAASYGYTSLFWYRDGSEGMSDWDIPLVESTPVPLQLKGKREGSELKAKGNPARLDVGWSGDIEHVVLDIFHI